MVDQEKPRDSKKRKGPPLWFFVLFIFAIFIGLYLGYSDVKSGKYDSTFTFDAVSAGVPFRYDSAPKLISLLKTGSSAPYSFYLGSGVGFPPMGLKLGIDGVLKGTPTGTGASKFQICVKDVGGRSACKNFSMTVAPKTTTASKTSKPSVPASTPTPVVNVCPTAVEMGCGSVVSDGTGGGLGLKGTFQSASCGCPSGTVHDSSGDRKNVYGETVYYCKCSQ